MPFFRDDYLRAFDPVTAGGLQLAAEDTEWNPDWQSFDTSAPISSMLSLYTPASAPIHVNWSGSDAGPSGLRNFDVQVKDGAGGAWINWLTQTAQTSAQYPGVGGHTYYFRVRARDNSGNLRHGRPLMIPRRRLKHCRQ